MGISRKCQRPRTYTCFIVTRLCCGTQGNTHTHTHTYTHIITHTHIHTYTHIYTHTCTHIHHTCNPHAPSYYPYRPYTILVFALPWTCQPVCGKHCVSVGYTPNYTLCYVLQPTRCCTHARTLLGCGLVLQIRQNTHIHINTHTLQNVRCL